MSIKSKNTKNPVPAATITTSPDAISSSWKPKPNYSLNKRGWGSDEKSLLVNLPFGYFLIKRGKESSWLILLSR